MKLVHFDTGAFLLIGPFVTGVVLLVYGIWPRRRGTTPHCSRCGYNLTGLQSNRCPECGISVTAKTIRYGRRYRRPRIIVLGSVCLVLAAGVLLGLWRGVDLYPYAPTAWVMSDLQSSQLGTSYRALGELERRIRRGRLSPAQQTGLIDIALAEQAAGEFRKRVSFVMHFLGRSYLAGRLTQVQEEKFFKNMFSVDFAVRPRVLLGEPVPYKWTWRNRTLRGFDQGDFQATLTFTEVSLDGENLLPRPIETRGEERIDPLRLLPHWPADLGSDESTLGIPDLRVAEFEESTFPFALPGRHTLRLSAHLQIRLRSFSTPPEKEGHLCYEDDLVMQQSFEMLEDEPPGLIRFVHDPSVKESLMGSIRPQIVARRGKPKLCRWDLEGLPIDCSFNVVARAGGVEHFLGRILLRKEGRSERIVEDRLVPSQSFDLPAGISESTSVDLIFRPNGAAAASMTVDVFEVWEGELVYEEVAIKNLSSAPGPGR